jgi:hypothetical protein
MHSDLAPRFAQVRLSVAVLGQADAAAWWGSSFLTANGIAYAQFNFPRAPFYAAVNATTMAAKRLHDDRIGRRRCVHLFRLALGDERLVQQSLRADEGEGLRAISLRREDALQVLEREGGEIIAVEPGPVQVGNVADAFTEAGLQELAKHYLAAFRQDIQCLPYFANPKR